MEGDRERAPGDVLLQMLWDKVSEAAQHVQLACVGDSVHIPKNVWDFALGEKVNDDGTAFKAHLQGTPINARYCGNSNFDEHENAQAYLPGTPLNAHYSSPKEHADDEHGQMREQKIAGDHMDPIVNAPVFKEFAAAQLAPPVLDRKRPRPSPIEVPVEVCRPAAADCGHADSNARPADSEADIHWKNSGAPSMPAVFSAGEHSQHSQYVARSQVPWSGDDAPVIVATVMSPYAGGPFARW